MSRPLPIRGKEQLDEWDINRDDHNSLLQHRETAEDRANNVHVQESRNAPLFSVDIARTLTAHIGESPFPQYALLGKNEKTYNTKDQHDEHRSGNGNNPKHETENHFKDKAKENRIFINMNAPFSAFLCGSQGSGKSHTLSCMLEGALKDSQAGKLTQPMAGLVFHYDKSSRSETHQPCEAAYLCSIGIPVRVLVPVSSVHRMEKAYANLPGLPASAQKPMVCPLLLKEEHLDVTSLMSLMKVGADKGSILYMEVRLSSPQANLEYKQYSPAIDIQLGRVSHPSRALDQAGGSYRRQL